MPSNGRPSAASAARAGHTPSRDNLRPAVDKTPNATRSGSGWAVLLGLSYPVLAHIAVLSGQPALIAGSVGLLVLLILLQPLRRGRPWAWAVCIASVAGLFALSASSAATLPLFLPPVLIHAFMAWVFGHTLLDDRVPLIERIIRALHEPDEDLDPSITRYARRLTAIWTALFVALATVNLTLALCASPDGLLLAAGIQPPISVPLGVWSLFANVMDYVFVGALFVGEYAWRQHVFPQQRYRNIVDFTRRVVRLGALFHPARSGPPPNP
jgi:uncharacterized membrane protein